MGDFIEFILLVIVAYLVWRISDHLPDLMFRITEIQRDVADIRKRLIELSERPAPATKKAAPKKRKPAKSKSADE